MYAISPFVLEEGDAGSACTLLSATGSASIADANLVAVLREIATMPRCAPEKDILAVVERHGSAPGEAMRFLRCVGVLRPVRRRKKLVVFSKSAGICRAIAECGEWSDGLRFSTTTDIEGIGKPAILVAVQEAYSPGAVRDLYAACDDNPECIILHAYFVFRHFVIDGFYSRSLAATDHFAGLHRLAGFARNRSFKPISWVDFFVKAPRSLEELSPPTFKPSPVEVSAALYLLYVRLRPFLARGAGSKPASDFRTIIEMNLDTGRVDRH